MHSTLRNRALPWALGAALLLLLAACGNQETPTPTFELSVTVQGDGVVTSDPAGIDTAQADGGAAEFDEDTTVILTATADAGFEFDGWTGDCTGADCTVTMDAAKSVTATFVAEATPTNTLTVDADEGGDVTSDPAGIDTAQTDGGSADFDEGSTVTLTAAADAGYRFDGWDGDCSGTDLTCDVVMDADKNVTAAFVATEGTVSVAVSQSSDDAEELVNGSGTDVTTFPPGHTYTHSGDLELTYDDGTNPGEQLVGVRFQGIDVPQGATITSASITFTADGNTSGAVTLSIAGIADTNPLTFNDDDDGATSSDLSNRATTTATVSWTPSDWTGTVEYATDDLSTVVQEIVDQSGWKSGNPIGFIVEGPGAAPLRRAFAYDYESPTLGLGAYAPQLDIEWELPAP